MRHLGWAGIWIASAWVASALIAAPPYQVLIDRNVAETMRDGVVLRSDIYRPKGDDKFPVILERTPYNKAQGVDFGLKAAASGYIVVIQDVRGRYASGGEWYPYRYESRDGYDSVEWAAALPYANGKVGLYGGSYVGATVMLAAVARPPHLAALFSVETGDSYYEGWTYRGGALQQWLLQTWTSILAIDSLDRQAVKNAKIQDWARDLPAEKYPFLGKVNPRELAPYYRDWLSHPSYDGYWKQWALNFSNVSVPGYHIGGWYDVFSAGTVRAYSALRAQAASAEARQGQRLIMGPWTHGGLAARKSGAVDFGPAAALDVEALALRWFDYELKGISNGLEKQEPVRIFVMGANVWRDEDAWPLSRARDTRYYIGSGGKANSLQGVGTLSSSEPHDEPADKILYDPAHPAPTVGGNLCCGGIAPGAQDQRPVESRNDVLVYSTAPFAEDFEVTGPVSADLFVSSSAVDSDITAKLVDVWPNGFAQNLAEGILRLRYRKSLEKPEFLNPGEVTRIRVDLGPISNVFRPKHRLRLEISSSNFPHFDRNPNTGEAIMDPKFAIQATNAIYHDREHPSALILPVVTR